MAFGGVNRSAGHITCMRAITRAVISSGRSQASPSSPLRNMLPCFFLRGTPFVWHDDLLGRAIALNLLKLLVPFLLGE